MTKVKATALDTVIPPAAVIDNTAPAIAPYSLNHITATMQGMTSIILTTYLTAFYNDTEQAVINGSLSPVLKLILDKGFARHWTEHNSTFSKLPEGAKLDSIREAFKFWNVGVLTKSAYDSLFKTPATAISGNRGNTVYKTLAARIITMSQSADVELSHRKHYQKAADNLLKNGKAAYDAMLAIPTAALIIRNAEAAILADVPALSAIDLDFS